jgi:hydrophobic/amphiphilic exporter-1 (mainly G- bacteria), HAE1 family
MSVINISVKRPIGTIMFYVAIILLGAISLSKLSINLLPDLSYPKITVVTDYPGAGPEEIERFITNELEGPLSSIPGVKKIDSVSKEGLSVISLEFHWGTDMDFALLHTKEKSEGARRLLPDDCEAPMIMEWDPSSAPILTVIMRSKKLDLKTQKETAEYIVKPRLEQLEGISRVEIRGGDEEEISVEIDPEKVKNIGISLSDVASAIVGDNVIQSSGTIKKDKLRYILKVEGEIKKPEEIEDIVVHRLGDRIIQVKDIGRAFFKNKLKQGNIRYNSMSSISLLLYRESGGNTVDATVQAEKTLKNLEKEFGKDLEFQVVAMEAELIVSSINSLKSSLIWGGALAFFILLLFLQNYRDPMLVSVVIPISVIATFVLMYGFKVNVNIMSLGGLVLGVGMFVDNSIVVLESIFRHRDTEALIPSVIKGAREVSGAITASTFTTISIFLPVIYLYGITGKLFRDQALTVSFSLISSLVVAITLLPALSAFKAVFKTDFFEDKLKGKGNKKWYHIPLKGLHEIVLLPFRLVGYIIYFLFATIFIILRFLFVGLGKGLNLILKPTYKVFNSLYKSFDDFYHKILEKMLDNKSIAVLLSVIILALMFGGFLLLEKELLPSPDSRKFEISANTVPSYGFEQTDAIASDIETKLLTLDGVKFVFTESGAVSTFAASTEDISVNSLHFIVECDSTEIRRRVMANAREILKKSELQDYTTYLEKNTLSQYLSTSGENFQLKIFYNDLESGKLAVERALAEIKTMEGIYDINTTTTEGKPLLAAEFKQDVLNKYNIRKDLLADYINQAVRGEQAGTLKQTQKNFDILVRVPVDGMIGMSRLLSLPITIGENTFFLKDLVELKERPSIKKITRESQERFFLISGDVRGVPLNEFIKVVEAKLDNVNFPPSTRFAFSGEEEERRKAFESLNEAIWLAILLVYMIMAAKFENLMQPFIIMFTVPMGLIGAFLFLLLSGNTLNIISGIGILVLIGIGVNDAIVKVEYSNQLRQEGKGIRDAVMTASRVRLRPILMTTFTTIFGVLPMGFMSQTGSELQKPLALVIIGGLLFTTFLTLLLIPVSYEFLESIKEKRKQKAAAKVTA